MMFRLLLTVVFAVNPLASLYPPYLAYKTLNGSITDWFFSYGIRIRLMSKGLNYILQDLAGDLLQKEAPKRSIPSFRLPINMGFWGSGYADMWGIKIASFHKPEIYSKLSRNRVLLSTNGGNTTVTGTWQVKYWLWGEKLVEKIGSFTLTARNITLELGCLVSQDTSNRPMSYRPHIYVTSCEVAVGYLHLDIRGGGNVVGGVARSNRETLEQEIRNYLKNQCIQIASINEAANHELGKHILESSVIPLNKKFSLNYELSGDPVVTPDYIEFLHQGEISWHNEGGTPFAPHPIPAPPHNTTRMLHLYYSDFVMNSFLHSAFRHNEMRYLMSPQSTPKLKSFLRTTCSPDECIGTVMNIGKNHPDKMVSVQMQASQMPNVTIERSRANMHVIVDGSMFVEDEAQTHLFDFTAKFLGELKLRVRGQRLIGELDIEDMQLEVTNSSIKLNGFLEAMEPLLERFVNHKLEQGFLIPTIKNAELVSPELRLFNRTLEIATDVRVRIPDFDQRHASTPAPATNPLASLYPPYLAYKTLTGSPETNSYGIRIRLMSKGLDYINDFAADLLQKIRIPPFSIPFNAGSGSGTAHLWGVKIASFHKPEIYSKLSSRNRVLWSTKGGSATATGRFKATYILLDVTHRGSGTFTLKVKDIKFELGCSVSQDSTHRPHINITSCKAAVGDVDLVLDGGGYLIWLAEWFITFEELVLNSVKNELCKQTASINEAANHELGKHILESSVIPLNKNFSLNYELSGDPVVTPDYIDFLHQGEISWHNEGGTPFSPHPIPALPHDTKRMLHLYYSDFVINSFLHAAFRHNEMRYLLSPQSTPDLTAFLQTTCPPDECIGTVMNIGKNHPDKMVSVQLQASQMPNVTIERSRANMHVIVDGSMFVEDEAQTHLFDFTAKFLGQLKLRVRGQRLIGELEIEDMQLQVTNSSMGRVSWTNNDFLVAMKPLLERFVNHKLEQGFLIPTIKNAELVSPELRLFNRTLEIATDIRVRIPDFLIHASTPAPATTPDCQCWLGRPVPIIICGWNKPPDRRELNIARKKCPIRP